MRVFFSSLAVLCALAAIWFLGRDLVPPKELSFAAGGRNGGYWKVAEQYRSILARDGITVTILETAGSGENAQLLANGSADVAILQGGINAQGELEALAAIFREPVFIFARSDAQISSNPAQWEGLRIAAGGEGSGTRVAIDSFFAAVGLTPVGDMLQPLGGAAASQALLTGDVDMAAFVAPLNAPYLQPLYKTDRVSLVSLEHVPAIVGKLAHSQVVTLPAGSFAMRNPSPAQDVSMIALNARLVGQATLHPSLVDRLIEAAKEIHGPRDVITGDNEFPTLETLAMPVDVYAGDLLRNGTSSLQPYLPYWIVAQISRVAILMLPILFLLLPLLRALPGLYAWRMRHRVFRHYHRLRELDGQVPQAAKDELKDLSKELDEIDADLAQLKLPLPYSQYAFDARMHIELLKRRILSRRKSLLRQAKERLRQAKAIGIE